jgi:hypothetical protein
MAQGHAKKQQSAPLTCVHLGLELRHRLGKLGQVGGVHQRHAQLCGKASKKRAETGSLQAGGDK